MTEVFIAKLLVAVVVVVGLSVLAEHVSPRIAGLLSGYPTGSAISLFFFGLEISPTFAAESAVYNMIGLVAMQTFIYAYYRASLQYGIIISSIIATTAYLISIWILNYVSLHVFAAALIPTASIFIFIWLFQPIKNTVVQKKVQLNHSILLMRAIFAASIILFITGIANTVGPTWSGLFSAFPTTLFPLMLIIHFTYDTKHVHTVIKNVPFGIFSLVLYSLSVSIVYPIYGIYWGTIISFIVATIYLFVYEFVCRKIVYQSA